MRSPLIFLSLALVAGVAIGVIIQNDRETPASTATPSFEDTAIVVANAPNEESHPNTADATADITKLNLLFQKEIQARKDLEKRLEALNQQVAKLSSNSASATGQNPSDQTVDRSDLDGSDKDWFNEQALLDAGIDSSQANQLKDYFEQLEMERLYLRDQSVREDWSREQLREAMQTLANKEDELKNQLGESAYDSYLYASGQPNRVAVTSVLSSAPAGNAGILTGDHIIRYDNQRIYDWRDLREATASGNVNDTVTVEVERDGKTMQFYLARGPLGIRMNSVSVGP